MNLETVKPEPEQAVQTEQDRPAIKIDRQQQAEIIDNFIMGKPIEKEVQIQKLNITLRAPNVAIVNDIYKDVAKAANENYVNMQVESSARMIAAYVRVFNGRDMEAELGERFDTIEGKKLIREEMDKILIEPIRDILSDMVYQFYEEVKLAFTADALYFS